MIRERREKLKMIQGFGVLATGRNELLLSEIEKSIDGQFFFFFQMFGKASFRHRNPSGNVK